MFFVFVYSSDIIEWLKRRVQEKYVGSLLDKTEATLRSHEESKYKISQLHHGRKLANLSLKTHGERFGHLCSKLVPRLMSMRLPHKQ